MAVVLVALEVAARGLALDQPVHRVIGVREARTAGHVPARVVRVAAEARWTADRRQPMRAVVAERLGPGPRPPRPQPVEGVPSEALAAMARDRRPGQPVAAVIPHPARPARQVQPVALALKVPVRIPRELLVDHARPGPHVPDPLRQAPRVARHRPHRAVAVGERLEPTVRTPHRVRRVHPRPRRLAQRVRGICDRRPRARQHFAIESVLVQASRRNDEVPPLGRELRVAAVRLDATVLDLIPCFERWHKAAADARSRPSTKQQARKMEGLLFLPHAGGSISGLRSTALHSVQQSRRTAGRSLNTAELHEIPNPSTDERSLHRESER
jgi:hypothetical protein